MAVLTKVKKEGGEIEGESEKKRYKETGWVKKMKERERDRNIKKLISNTCTLLVCSSIAPYPPSFLVMVEILELNLLMN